jgi:hypothetical protein
VPSVTKNMPVHVRSAPFWGIHIVNSAKL